MKKNSIILAAAFSLFAVFVLSVDSSAQIFAEDLRPFDFRDKYYEENGIFAWMLEGRKNGADGASVFDTPTEIRFTNVRITETFPAYDDTGAAIFWNYYGGASKETFMNDSGGAYAAELAYAFPMYVFPSSTVKDSDRQAALIRMDNSYYEKNPLGIAAVFVVEYTKDILTSRERRSMQSLADRNGLSLDGTPIIRAAKELEELSREGLVTIRAADRNDDGRTGFAVAKVLQTSRPGGAIAADSFLVYVKDSDGGPLKAEAHFLSMFECFQRGQTACF